MSEYEEAKARIQSILNELNQCEDSEEEAHDWAHKLDLLLQATDEEIADLQYRAGFLETQNSDLAGHIRGQTCMMCNYLERAICFEQKTDLEKEIATKDAELARLREALEKIAKPEMPVNALVLMKIAQEALKSNDS